LSKKKVLILAYDFPPYISVGGLRPYAWFNYFDKSQFELTVVTRFWDKDVINAVDCVKPTSINEVEHRKESDGDVYRIPFKPNLRDKILLKYGFKKFVLFRRILSFLIDSLKHQFFYFDKYKELYYTADNLLNKQQFDYIVVTGEPFVLFKYGYLLSKKHHVKWIADYRDGWTTNQKKEKMSKAEFVLNELFKRYEKKYISNVSLITTAAPSYKKELKKLFPNKKMEVVYNGYLEDQEVFEIIQKAPLEKEKLIVTYVGTLYAHQKVELFLQGALKLIREYSLKPSEFEIRFVGMNFYQRQKDRVLSFSEELNNHIVFTDKLDFKHLHIELQKSSVLLLLTKKNLDWLNAKIFDYILSDKRVMLVENDYGIMQDILCDVSNQSYLCDDENDVFDSLKEAYREFQKGEGLKNRNKNIDHYKRSFQTKILEKILINL